MPGVGEMQHLFTTKARSRSAHLKELSFRVRLGERGIWVSSRVTEAEIPRCTRYDNPFHFVASRVNISR